MSGGSRPGAGRKPVQMDLVQLEKLAALQCTDEEIAAWFGVSARTMEKRRQQPEFAGALKRGRARGRISVRRAQMKLLAEGSASIAIWLGKQLLGQRDLANAALSGPGGVPVETTDARKIVMERIEAIAQRLRGEKEAAEQEPAPGSPVSTPLIQ